MLCLVAQSCLTLCVPVDWSPPGSFVHGDYSGKNTWVGCHALFQKIFPTQGSNPGLLHCRSILYCLSHWGSPNCFVFSKAWKILPSLPQGIPVLNKLWISEYCNAIITLTLCTERCDTAQDKHGSRRLMWPLWPRNHGTLCKRECG